MLNVDQMYCCFRWTSICKITDTTYTQSHGHAQSFSVWVIFTGVLEEEEDVLVNVGLVDKEKAEKNVELKKKKPDYKPYDEEESVDDMVIVRLHLKFSKCIKTTHGQNTTDTCY